MSVVLLSSAIKGRGGSAHQEGSNSGEPPYNDGMESRVKALEDAHIGARERLVRIETKLDHVASKADVSTLEGTLLKWFIGTACTLTGLAFAAAKLIN